MKKSILTLDDEAFGYLKRVIVTPAVYPRLVEFLHFDIQHFIVLDTIQNYTQSFNWYRLYLKHVDVAVASCSLHMSALH